MERRREGETAGKERGSDRREGESKKLHDLFSHCRSFPAVSPSLCPCGLSTPPLSLPARPFSSPAGISRSRIAESFGGFWGRFLAEILRAGRDQAFLPRVASSPWLCE